MIDIDKIERLLSAGVSHSGDIAALIAEVRALREDAERYRWLRDTERLKLGPPVGPSNEKRRYVIAATHIGSASAGTETLDAAIDAAREAIEQ